MLFNTAKHISELGMQVIAAEWGLRPEMAVTLERNYRSRYRKNEYSLHILNSQEKATARAASAVADPSEVILPLLTDMMRLLLEQCVQFPWKCFSNTVKIRKWKERSYKIYLEAEETALHRTSSACLHTKKNLVTWIKWSTFFPGEDTSAELF